MLSPIASVHKLVILVATVSGLWCCLVVDLAHDRGGWHKLECHSTGWTQSVPGQLGLPVSAVWGSGVILIHGTALCHPLAEMTVASMTPNKAQEHWKNTGKAV